MPDKRNGDKNEIHTFGGCTSGDHSRQKQKLEPGKVPGNI